MNSHPQKRSRQAGFSLLELTVTMGIMVVVLGVSSKLMTDALRTSTVVNETTEAQQSLRAAHEIITRDLLVLGDGLSGLGEGNIRVPLSFAQSRLVPSPNGVVNITGANAHSYVPLSLAISDNDTSRAGTVPALLPQTDRFTMMTEVPDPSFPVSIIGDAVTTVTRPNANTLVANVPAATAALFKAGEVVLVVSSATGVGTFAAITQVTTGANRQVHFASGDAYGLNTPGLPLLTPLLCSAGGVPCTNVNFTVMRVQLITYFVGPDGLLRRRVLGNPRRGNITQADFVARAMEGEVISEHVSEFQVRYGLVNTVNRGAWDRVEQMTALQQPNVREVEVEVTAETPHKIMNDGQRAKATSVSRTSVRTMEYRNTL